VQAIHALGKKTATPFANRCRINPQAYRNILVPRTRAGRKHNPPCPLTRTRSSWRCWR
jgi:hypothetical protein